MQSRRLAIPLLLATSQSDARRLKAWFDGFARVERASVRSSTTGVPVHLEGVVSLDAEIETHLQFLNVFFGSSGHVLNSVLLYEAHRALVSPRERCSESTACLPKWVLSAGPAQCFASLESLLAHRAAVHSVASPATARSAHTPALEGGGFTGGKGG